MPRVSAACQIPSNLLPGLGLQPDLIWAASLLLPCFRVADSSLQSSCFTCVAAADTAVALLECAKAATGRYPPPRPPPRPTKKIGK